LIRGNLATPLLVNYAGEVKARGEMITLPGPVADSSCAPQTVRLRASEGVRACRDTGVGCTQAPRREPGAKGLRKLDPAAPERRRQRIQVQRLEICPWPPRRA
jgi:hypothetical protein